MVNYINSPKTIISDIPFKGYPFLNVENGVLRQKHLKFFALKVPWLLKTVTVKDF